MTLRSRDVKVVTVCGSMRFYSLMLRVAEHLTAEGVIVLMPFVSVHEKDQGGQCKRMLDKLHRDKIDMSDAIAVVTDESGYYGESTSGEIIYAHETGKSHVLYEVSSGITPRVCNLQD